MVSLLMDTVTHCERKASFRVLASGVCAKTVIDQCHELNITFEKLEGCGREETSHQLRYIKEPHSLAHRFDVRALATTLSHSTAGIREYLTRALEKLGRYRAIAAGLANASRTMEHSLFQHIAVQPITAPELLPKDFNLINALQDFESIWSRATKTISHERLHPLRDQASTNYQRRL